MRYGRFWDSVVVSVEVTLRFLAMAAFAGMFWMSAATLRLIIHGDRPDAAPVAKAKTPPLTAPVSSEPLTEPAVPAPRSDCAIEHWPDVSRGGSLTIQDLRCGIGAAKPRMQACLLQYGEEPRHGRMDVLVGRSGKVLSARFSDGRARTAVVACFENALKSVTYPRLADRYSFPLAWVGFG